MLPETITRGRLRPVVVRPGSGMLLVRQPGAKRWRVCAGRYGRSRQRLTGVRGTALAGRHAAAWPLLAAGIARLGAGLIAEAGSDPAGFVAVDTAGSIPRAGASAPPPPSRSRRRPAGPCAARPRSAATVPTPPTSSERIRSLVARGVLTGFHAAVDQRLLGRPLEAIIAVRLRPQSHHVVDAFRAFVLSLPETLALFEVTGPNDCMLHVAVADMHDLRGFILDCLTQRPEVAEVQTSTVYQRTSKHVPEPLGSPRHG